MSRTITLRFESNLRAPRERVWEWMTSVRGISAEMHPVMRMTTPRGVSNIADVEIKLGVPLFRSRILLLGLLPIDYSDLTLIEFDRGNGFVEQSPMGSMKLWRHERYIVAHPSASSTVVLVDQLTFCPRRAGSLVAWFIRRFFEHRHAVLRAHLDGC